MNNSQKRGSLLASFLTTEEEEVIMAEVQHIADNFELTNQYIFLLKNPSQPEKKILTYNAVTTPGNVMNTRLFTMRIHRKKSTNTLYTINALNLAVAAEHDGQTGRHLKLDWEKYTNNLLLVTSGRLVVHEIEVLKIFKIEPPETPASEE